MLEEFETVILPITEEDSSFKRIDLFLVAKLPHLSRSLIKKYFEKGFISYDDDTKLELKKSPIVGKEIIINLPPPDDVDIKPQNIPLDILFEDEHLLVINKQAGLVIHPAAGNPDGTLVNAILYHCPNLAGIGHERRPGIVHRLDKGTTGVMVVAKSQPALEGLIKLFSEHDIKRQYEAICVGIKMKQAGTLSSLIGRHKSNRIKMSTITHQGKDAITHYKVLKQFECLSHIEFTLETGRTHQIRVHAAELLKSPLLCDSVYGSIADQQRRIPNHLKSLTKDYEYPMLHAKLLGFIHPITKEELLFEAPPHDDFANVLKEFE